MGRCRGSSKAGAAVAGTWLLALSAVPVLAAPPPRIRIEAHTVSPRYAYALGLRTMHIQRNCTHGVGVLRLRVQVINRGTRRIDLPVRLRVGTDDPGQSPVSAPVPRIAPGHDAWVSIDVPIRRHQGTATVPHIDLSLAAAGQVWNRQQWPAQQALASCPGARPMAAMHARENIR